MSTETTPRIATVEDAEGFGTCHHCGRDGLRWIVTLTDGTRWGSGCARKALGLKTSTAGLAWTAAYTATAVHNDGNQTYALWTRTDGRPVARITIDGHAYVTGPLDTVTAEYNTLTH